MKVAIRIIAIIIFILAISFGVACLATWAICFIAGLFGMTLVFSWKLALAIWIVMSLLNTKITINKD